jgi:hypothetical protein
MRKQARPNFHPQIIDRMKAQFMKEISNLYQSFAFFRQASNQEKTRTRTGSMSACARITVALAIPIPSVIGLIVLVNPLNSTLLEIRVEGIVSHTKQPLRG